MTTHALPNVIGFSGYARAGKDTLAEFMVSEFGYERIAFADNLRDFIVATNPLTAEIVNAVGWDVAKLDPEVRQSLSDIGNAARGSIHRDVWIFAALSDLTGDEFVAVSDVRYPNEADDIKARGGRLIRVERPGVGPANTIDTLLDDYDGFDAVIQNDSTIEVLHSRMRTFLEWALMKSGTK